MYKKSFWTLEEDSKFLAALESLKWGHWPEIAERIGTKTADQVKYRATYLVLRQPNATPLCKVLTEKYNSRPEAAVAAKTNITTTVQNGPLKRIYTRTRTIVTPKKPPSKDKPVEISNEDVSIVSSSSSSNASNESINIMSSSSSESVNSVSTKASGESTTSKVSNSSVETKASKASTSSKKSTTSKASKTSKSSVTSAQSKKSTISKASTTSKSSTSSKTSKNSAKSKDSSSAWSTSESTAIEPESNPTPIVDEPAPVTPKTPAKSRSKKDEEMIMNFQTSSARKRKIRNADGDWIDPSELEGQTIDHQPTPRKDKPKRKTPRKAASNASSSLDANDPFRLIWLNDYATEDALSPSEMAPFRVEIETHVLCIIDFHSHLFSSEIIGLLGGTFDPETSLLRITCAFPCKSSHSTGTEVDVDPISEIEAGEFFEQQHVRMIGWYHSHPNFEPNPSLRDLETQTIYQGLCRGVDGGVEAFVGLICNPYLAATESSSHIECFYVAQSEGSGLERLPYRIPLEKIGKINSETVLPVLQKLVEMTTGIPEAFDMNRASEGQASRLDKLVSSIATHSAADESFLLQIRSLFPVNNVEALATPQTEQ